MEMDVRVLVQPALILLVGVEIIEDDVQLAIREGGNDALHEAEELDTVAPRGSPAGALQSLSRTHAWRPHWKLDDAITLKTRPQQQGERAVANDGPTSTLISHAALR